MALTVSGNAKPAQAADGPDINYGIWTLNMPTGGITSSGDLLKGVRNPYWYAGTGAFSGYDMFQTPALGKGKKAFGSDYVRSELREILPDGAGSGSGSWGTNAKWGSKGYNKMVTEVKVELLNATPSPNSSRNYTCIGQVWGSGAMFELRYGKMTKNGKDYSFSVLQSTPNTTKEISDGPYIPLGKAFTVTYECIGGTVKVWVESQDTNPIIGKTKIYEGSLATPSDESFYFKVGNYDMSSSTKDDPNPNPNDRHTVVGFKSIAVEHNPIQGRLTYANGNPLAGQTVNYVLSGGGMTKNASLSAKTDANGYYFIANVPGSGNKTSNGGRMTASVTITAPSIAGHTANKNFISVASVDTTTITTVRSGNNYDIVYTPNSQQEPTPNASVNYTAETLTGLSGAYSINNGNTVNITGQYAINVSWFGTTIKIVKKGNGATTTDSAAQNLTIKARPAIPVLGKTDCTTSANNDGTIRRASSAMEYSADNGVTWNAVSGSSSTISGLKPQIYYVRYKAANSEFASDNVVVEILNYDANATMHKVKPGETLSIIANIHGTTYQAIMTLNKLPSTYIFEGQLLRIP